MDRCEKLDRFKFHQKCSVYEQIGSVATIETNSLVPYRDGFLSLERNVSQGQLVTETHLITGFEKTRPECAVNIYCRPDYRFCQLINVPNLCALCVLRG